MTEVRQGTCIRGDASCPPPAFGPGPGRGHKRADRTNEGILARWREPGPEGFYNWLADVEPRILTRANQYEPFQPTDRQREEIDSILAIDQRGRFVHTLSLLIEPRRHGKNTVFALIVLWLLTSRENWVCQLLGNTLDHARRVQFRLLKRIIVHSPKLSAMVPSEWHTANEISFPPLDSRIQLGEGVNLATAFGDRLSCLWVSDFHASPDLGPFNALQAALLDTEDSLCLIDSNVDPMDGHVHALQKGAAGDPSIFAHHGSYRNLKDFEANAPAWIDRGKARRLQKTALPADFKRDILGQRSDAKNALFPSEVIKRCQSAYKTPVADLKSISLGRSYKIGGGLDRSKNLMGGDNTVWTVVAKIASPESGEPEVYVLNQVVFTLNTGRAIKKAILQDHERYRLDNVVLENYEVADLAPWLADQKIPFELVSPHERLQNSAFPEFARIAREGRLHFSSSQKQLQQEMQTFTYQAGRAGMYRFGHATTADHDDCVYSLNWAIFALREAVLAAYSLGSFVCHNRSPHRAYCFLMGKGDLELPGCKQDCPAYQRVEEMFRQFKQVSLDDELTLPEFYADYVRFEGARISQAA
ncbi:MAG: hypothetical protein KQI62_09485 [Deltaproteobacteria bacterium]|nr:hypothetical protein [Deltaproteobacteria bacterium]